MDRSASGRTAECAAIEGGVPTRSRFSTVKTSTPPRSSGAAPTRSPRFVVLAALPVACAHVVVDEVRRREPRALHLLSRSFSSCGFERQRKRQVLGVVPAAVASPDGLRREALSLVLDAVEPRTPRHAAIATYGLMSAAVWRNSMRAALSLGPRMTREPHVRFSMPHDRVQRRPNARYVALVAVDER